MSSILSGKLESFFKLGLKSPQPHVKIEPQALGKLTILVAKQLNKSQETFLSKHEGGFDPQKKFRLVYQGIKKTPLDKITLSQYSALFDIKELKDSLEQAGIKQAHSFERKGTSLLHGACFFGLPYLFCFLLKQKISPSIQDKAGNTPLHTVLESPLLTEDQKYFLSLTLLEDYKADILKANTKGETPLHLACSQGLSTVIVLFLNTNLMLTIILNKRADPNSQDKDGNTPLHTLLVSPLLTEPQKHDLTKFLLDNSNANIDKVNANGETPLHLACAQGLSTVIDLFLNAKAKTHIKDRDLKIAVDRISDLTDDEKVTIIDIFKKFPEAKPDIKKIIQIMKYPVELQTPQFVSPLSSAYQAQLMDHKDS